VFACSLFSLSQLSISSAAAKRNGEEEEEAKRMVSCTEKVFGVSHLRQPATNKQMARTVSLEATRKQYFGILLIQVAHFCNNLHNVTLGTLRRLWHPSSAVRYPSGMVFQLYGIPVVYGIPAIWYPSCMVSQLYALRDQLPCFTHVLYAEL
jgi:hypothetical protein